MEPITLEKKGGKVILSSLQEIHGKTLIITDFNKYYFVSAQQNEEEKSIIIDKILFKGKLKVDSLLQLKKPLYIITPKKDLKSTPVPLMSIQRHQGNFKRQNI